MKKFTIDNFSRGEVLAAAEGSLQHGWDSRLKWEVNCSSILDALIRYAAKYTDRFASDLLISWDDLREKLEAPAPEISKKYLFGFYDSGIDHNAFIFNKLSDAAAYGGRPYNKLLMLEVETDGDEINMTLSVPRW